MKFTFMSVKYSAPFIGVVILKPLATAMGSKPNARAS